VKSACAKAVLLKCLHPCRDVRFVRVWSALWRELNNTIFPYLLFPKEVSLEKAILVFLEIGRFVFCKSHNSWIFASAI
jgi:hypothetical protein